MGEVGEEEEDQEDFLVGTGGGGGGDGVRGRARGGEADSATFSLITLLI